MATQTEITYNRKLQQIVKDGLSHEQAMKQLAPLWGGLLIKVPQLASLYII